MADVDEAGQPAKLLARMTAAGTSEKRAVERIAAGMGRVAGEPVLVPEALVPWPTRWRIVSA